MTKRLGKSLQNERARLRLKLEKLDKETQEAKGLLAGVEAHLEAIGMPFEPEPDESADQESDAA